MSQVVEADLTWTGSAFASGVQIAIDGDGSISNVGTLGRRPTTRLTGQAILPGFINTHSHAFQRGLRGAGERFPGGAGDFWSWRDAMYELVETVRADEFYDLCVSSVP